MNKFQGYNKLITEIEKHTSLSTEMLDRLMEFGKIETIKKNEYLLQSGQICHHGYFINSGLLIQSFLHESGKENVIGFYMEDGYAYLASVSSYFSGSASAFEIKALEDCEVIKYSKTHIDQLISEFPEFNLFYHRITALGFQNLFMFSAMRLSLNAEEFLLFLNKEHPSFLKRIPDKYIAQFMGVSSEWLSKLKKKLQINHLL